MTTAAIPVGQRDHSLVGADSWRAVEIGLAAADWHHTDLPRAVMKDPMKRSDKAAIRDTFPVVRVADRRGLGRHPFLGHLGGLAVFHAVWRDPWTVLRRPLA